MPTVTRTLKPDGTGDYTTFSGWDAIEATDLVVDGDSHVLECYSGTVNESFSLSTSSGWNTGPGNDITIKAASGVEHLGVLGAGFYHDGSFSNFVSHVTIQDLEFYNTGSGSTVDFRGLDSKMERCIVGHDENANGTAGTLRCGGFVSSAKDSTLFNNIIVYGGSLGMALQRGCSVRNCTVIETYAGGYATTGGPQKLFENSIFIGDTPSDISGGYDSRNNVFNDASEVGAAVDCIFNVSPTDLFTDYAGGDPDFFDLRLKQYSPAINAGTDLSSYFTDDIEGGTRP